MKLILSVFLLVGSCGVTVGLTREYVFNSNLSSWDDAQSYCRENYKDLATVTSVEEHKNLLQSGSGSAGSWTGLRRRSGVWTWADGSPLSFPNWFSNISFSLTDGYDCAVTSVSQGLAQNYNCNVKRSFYCYSYQMMVNEMKTWEEAQQYCRTHYTGLASVTSVSSLQQLQLETQSVWTGLHFTDGRWFWVSGKQLGSPVSMPSSCPAPSYRCGAFDTTTNTMNILNCNDTLNFICY